MKYIPHLGIAIVLAGILCFSQKVSAAHLNDAYYKDRIYLALTPEVAAHVLLAATDPAVPTQVDQDAFFNLFKETLQETSIRGMEVPFFQAQGSALERVIELFVDSETDLVALCATFDIHPAVTYAERVPRVDFMEKTFYPNDLTMDSNYSGQWTLHKIQAPEAWTIARGSKDIKVAVVDQAIDISHPDLQGVIWTNPGEIPDNGIDDDGNGYVDDVHGYDVAEDDPDPSPDNPNQTHGTHVAGLVSAETDNGLGIASIGFNLSIIPVKCETRNSSTALTYQGVIYAVKAGADIISCSWGGHPFSITNKEVIEYAQQQGALVVCSSGNDGRDGLAYPAAYPGVISVGATTILDRMAGFSNYHEQLSVAAPGNNILSTWVGNRYESISGTSMATPIVSGLLGLMKSHYPEINNDELKTCLLTTTNPMDVPVGSRYEGKTGAGRINAYKAMLCVDALKNGTSKIELGTASNKPLLYPNPSAGQLYLDLLYSGRMRIYDVAGTMVYEMDVLKGEQVLDISELSRGIYLLELLSVDGHSRYTEKIILQ